MDGNEKKKNGNERKMNTCLRIFNVHVAQGSSKFDRKIEFVDVRFVRKGSNL